MPDAPSKPLTDDQLAFYLREGYLVVPDLLDPASLQPIIADLSGRVDEIARRLYAEGRLSDLFDDEPFDTRLVRLYEAAADDDARKALWESVECKYYDLDGEGVYRMMTHPVILDVVEQLVGPEILFHSQSNIRAKLPNHAQGLVQWHQDAGNLSPDSEGTLMVNFWIPLVDVTMDMGGMQVLTGRHHHETAGPADRFNILEDELPAGEALDCPLPLGGVLIIQKRTIHRSVPNISGRMRWSLDFRYCSAREPAGRPGGFLARSRENPGNALSTYQAYVAKDSNRVARETDQARIAAEMP